MAEAKLKVVGHSAIDEPLLAALLARLPMPGQPFPADKRANWLRMWQMALDDLYGVAEDMPAFLKPVTALREAATVSGAIVQPATPPLPFYIDRDGFACRAGGARVNPQDVTDTIFDQRGEAGDPRTIIWADGRIGVAGLQLNIAAA